MAEQVRIDLIADDKASKPLDQVADKVADLEQDKVEIPVEADTKPAQRDVADLLAKVDRLSADPATLLLTSNATQIAGDIADLITDIDKLDASDPEVTVKTDQINTLQGDLDTIETKLKQINDVPVDVDTAPTKHGLDEVGKSASSSKSVLANMVGNATQDLGALGGVAGSAGVAIGQMGEYMADAAGEGDKFGQIIANFGKVAGPLAGLAAITGLVSQFIEAAQQADKLHADKVKEYADALHNGTDEMQAFIDKATEAQRIDFTAGGGGLFGVMQATQDLTPVLQVAGLTVEDFAAKVRDFSENDAVAYYNAFKGMGLSAQDAGKLLGAVRQEHDAQADAAARATQVNKVFGDQIAANAQKVSDAAYNTGLLQVAEDKAKNSTDNLNTAWNVLTGNLDSDQALLNVASQFDDIEAKAKVAWDAAKSGAGNAESAARDYQAAVISAKQEVVNLGRQIGLSIPETKRLLLQIDEGNLDAVERDLNIMARNRTMRLSVETVRSNYGVLGPGNVPIPGMAPTPPPVPAPVTTNVYMTLPRGTRPDDAFHAADRYARRNGGTRARR